MQNNSIEINTCDAYTLRIDCNKAEQGIATTQWGQYCIDALALNDPLEYARLALSGEMKVWADTQDTFEL